MRRLILLWLLLSIPAWATDYHVAKTGSGSTCSVGSPCLTIAAGLAKLVVGHGDTLYIHAGTYAETFTGAERFSGGVLGSVTTIKNYSSDVVWVQPPAGSGFALQTWGTSQKYILFDGVNFDCINSIQYDCVKVDFSPTLGYPSYITFQNLEIKNAYEDGILISDPLITNITIKNCNIHDSGRSGTIGHNIYLKGSYCTVENNNVHDGKKFGMQIYASVGTPSNNIVRNNLFSNNCTGNISTPSDGKTNFFTLGNDNLIYNNLIVDSQYCRGVQMTGSRNLFYNNTIYNNGLQGMDIYGGSSHVVRNNIVYGNGTGLTDESTASTKSNNLTTNPTFTSAGTGDFTLAAGSAAIGIGYDLSATFTTDYAGTSRTTPWDAGAYKYNVATPSITVISPNGGEFWQIGTSQSITWSSAGTGSTFDITATLNGDDGVYETTIASGQSGTSYAWTVSGSANANCKVKVKDAGAATFDVSNAVFATTAATVTGTITITAPTAGSFHAKGSNVIISWTTTDLTGNVTISLSRNGGTTYSTIGTYAYNAADVVYVATTPSSSNCKIKITSVNDAAVTATSSAFRLGGRIL